MKRIAVLGLAAVLTAALAASCGKRQPPTGKSPLTKTTAGSPAGGKAAPRSKETERTILSATRPAKAPVQASGQLPPNPTARDVLERMAAVYKTAKTFRLEAIIHTSESAGGKKQSLTTPITMEFARPNKMRIVTESRGRSVTLVSNGKDIYTYLPSARIYRKGPAPKTISGTQTAVETGITTPALLDGRDITPYLKTAKLLPSEKVNGVDTYVISYSPLDGKRPGLSINQRIWVGKSDFLIRQMISTRKISASALAKHPGTARMPKVPLVISQRTTVRTVSANVSIPESTFHFVPPPGAKLYQPSKPILPPDVSGKKAPDFSAATLDGRQISLSNYRGKPVLLVFWSSLSKSARRGMPEVQKLHEELKDMGIVILGVSLDGDKSSAEKFVKENGITFQNLYGPEKTFKMASDYGLRGLPTMFVISRNGTVKGSIVGPRTAEGMKSELARLGVR